MMKRRMPGGDGFVKAPRWMSFGGVPAPIPALAGFVAGALLALSRIPLQGLLGANAPFIMAWPGILFAAFMGGFWPATLVTVLSVPVAQWALKTGGGPALGPGGMVIFASFGLLFAVAGEARIRGLRRAKAYADRLAEIEGGMRPKLEACVAALEGGVRNAHIVDGRREHSLLLELFTDEGIGTKLFR